MKSIALPSALLALAGPACAATSRSGSDDHAASAVYRNAQRKFEHSLFVQAGFEPIVETNADGRDVRRILLEDTLALRNKAWLDARDAVLRFARIEEARQKDIDQLQQINDDAVNGAASEADKAKIARTLDGWKYFVRSQEPNYSELLQRLAWPRAS